MQELTTQIQTATEAMLAKEGITGTEVYVTPKTITIEGFLTETIACRIEAAFVKSGMTSLGTFDLAELAMGSGWGLTILH